jgi:hypothetical protein
MPSSAGSRLSTSGSDDTPAPPTPPTPPACASRRPAMARTSSATMRSPPRRSHRRRPPPEHGEGSPEPARCRRSFSPASPSIGVTRVRASVGHSGGRRADAHCSIVRRRTTPACASSSPSRACSTTSSSAWPTGRPSRWQSVEALPGLGAEGLHLLGQSRVLVLDAGYPTNPALALPASSKAGCRGRHRAANAKTRSGRAVLPILRYSERPARSSCSP